MEACYKVHSFLRSVKKQLTPKESRIAGIALILALLGATSLPSLLPGMVRKINLWRIDLTGSCAGLIREKEYVDSKLSAGDNGDLGLALQRLEIFNLQRKFKDRGINCDNVRQEIAKSKMGDSIAKINSNLDGRASLLSYDEVLLWPIEYATKGSEHARGKLMIITPGDIVWSGETASISVTHYDSEDWGHGDGVEEVEGVLNSEIDCLDTKHSELCKRLRELTQKGT
jgi:hypothetical protein